MAQPKRYFWMKLKESFMTSDTIDYFMAQPDGANYVVLYQMLCLKTINTDGRLSRQIGEVIIPYDIPKIQRDLKWFSADTIRVALDLYKSFGLIYVDVDGVLCLADHNNLVGSETNYAAQKRNQRLSSGKQLTSEAGLKVDKWVDIVHPDIEIDIRDRDKSIDRDKELDKEIELNNNTGISSTDSSESVCRTRDVRRITEQWNSLGLGQIVKLTASSKRGGNLRARVNEYGVEAVARAIEKVRDSDFLKGQNKDGWTITFDWFVKPNNFIKVLEGNYDNRTSAQQGPKPVASADRIAAMLRRGDFGDD